MLKKVILLIAVLLTSFAGTFLGWRYLYPSAEPVVVNQTKEIFITEEQGIVDVINRVSPLVKKENGQIGAIITADGLMATLQGNTQTQHYNLPVIDLVDWQEINLGERIIVVGIDRVETGIISKIEANYLLTNIKDYVDVNGFLVVNLQAQAVGLAKVEQGRIKIMPINLSFE